MNTPHAIMSDAHGPVPRPDAMRGAIGATFRTHHAAFTLVEIMVVIAILVLLIGIGLGVIGSVTGAGDEQATRMTLATADGIATEYYARTGTYVNHLGRTPIDWSTPKTHNDPYTADSRARIDDGSGQDLVRNSSIERFVWASFKIRDLREGVYTSFDENVLNDQSGNDFLELRDAWGNKIVYVQHVYKADDPDGVDRGEDDFLPPRTSPFFASAGPDGQWGSVDDQGVPDEDAEDNLYSFSGD